MKKSDKLKFTFDNEGGSLENMTEEGHYTSSENAPDKRIKYAELIQVLENEIKWCVANPAPSFHAEYRKGFTNGLIQAKYLVNELAHLKVPGYMGDIGGIGCDPTDRDAE